MKKIDLPQDVKYIIDALERSGYEAYAVGGCVRDTLLGRQPNDWDITTNAKPMEIKDIFRRTVDTGIAHGTVTVLIGKNTYEVTTYRIDGEYEDNRHPKQVEFTGSLIEDLKRRDFTINAMAYNDKVGIVDEFDGIGDMDRRLVRCVGEAKERFSEDALRIMRAIRFAAQLGYDIEEMTLTAASDMCGNLSSISTERINTELTKLLISPNPGMLREIYRAGILKVILPELDVLMEIGQNNPHHMYTVGEHIIRSIEEAEPDRVLRYTMLFHDLGKGATKTTDAEGIDHFHGHAAVSEELAGNIMRRLHFDNDTMGKVKKLVVWHDAKIEENDRSVRRAVNKLGEGMFPMLMKVQRADVLAQSTYKREEKLAKIDRLTEIYESITRAGDCVTIKELAVNGSDVIALGVNPGPEVGNILSGLLELVLEDPKCNTREYLLEKIKEQIG